MKRFLLVASTVALLLAGGWTALWFSGRSEVEDRIDLEFARLAREGIVVTHGTREVRGFPRGYQVDFTQLTATREADGALLNLPTLSASVEGAEGAGALRLVLPPEFDLRLPIPEVERMQDPDLPRIRTVSVTGAAMEVALTGAPGRLQTADLRADRLAVEVPDPRGTLTLGAEMLDAMLEVPAQGAGPRVRVLAGRLMAGADLPGSEIEQPSRTRFDWSDVAMTLTADLPDRASVAGILLAGARGSLDGAWQSGSYRANVEVGAAGAPETAQLAMTAASGSGLFNLTDGVADLRLASRAAEIALEVPDDRAPVAGALSMDTLETILSGPTAPSDIQRDLALRLAMIEVEGDARFWQMLDPDGVIDRSPAELVVDVVASGRLLRPLSRVLSGVDVPWELGNVSINEARIEAMGASATARGDIEFVPPIWLPLGTVEVDLTRPGAAIEQLHAAGLLGDEQRQMGFAIIEAYTRAGDAPDARASTVEYGPDGLTINGLPFN